MYFMVKRRISTNYIMYIMQPAGKSNVSFFLRKSYKTYIIVIYAHTLIATKDNMRIWHLKTI